MTMSGYLLTDAGVFAILRFYSNLLFFYSYAPPEESTRGTKDNFTIIHCETSLPSDEIEAPPGEEALR